jgi:hypothetical protein
MPKCCGQCLHFGVDIKHCTHPHGPRASRGKNCFACRYFYAARVTPTFEELKEAFLILYLQTPSRLLPDELNDKVEEIYKRCQNV